jgi:hypothetical protein
MSFIDFTTEELTFVSDQHFFSQKAKVSIKIRKLLEQLHVTFQEELKAQPLLIPNACDLTTYQLVKGEQLEHFPYQYLDFPKFYTREEKFAFRSLFWWGHHMAFALILEGGALRRYKENLINRYSTISDRGLCLGLDSNLWEWKNGPGYSLELTHDRKPEIAAVLAHRPFFKLTRFVPFRNLHTTESNLVKMGQAALRAVLPVITQ